MGGKWEKTDLRGTGHTSLGGGTMGRSTLGATERGSGTTDRNTMRLLRSPSAGGMEETQEMNPTWLIGNDSSGRTIFPYSLAAHRAFVDAQPEEWLREKAKEVAPLKLTSSW